MKLDILSFITLKKLKGKVLVFDTFIILYVVNFVANLEAYTGQP